MAQIIRTVIAYEILPWETVSPGSLSGRGPVRVLLSDDTEIVVKAGLGPGFWNRTRECLRALMIEDTDGILPEIK